MYVLLAPARPNLYLVNLPDFSNEHVSTGRMKNSEDPDQLASKKPADLDQHCFHV